MKIKDKRLLIYAAVLCALTTVAVVLRTVACFTQLDTVSSHFNDKGAITVARIFIALVCALAVSYLFVGKPRESLIADFHSSPTTASSGVLAVAFVFMGVENVTMLDYKSTSAEKLLSVFILILALGSFSYLFSSLFFGKRYSTLRGYLGMMPILCLSLYAALLYFDPTLPINAPSKIADQMAFVCAALFFTAEVRLSLGRESWRVYAPFAMISFAVASYSAIPSLIVYFATVSGQDAPLILSRSISESVLSLALAAYAIVRLLSTAQLSDDRQGKIAGMISERNLVGDTEQVEDTATYEYNNENQISIDDIIASNANSDGEEEI